MKLSELSPAKGAVKNRKRVGRGTGSGHGKTSTKGHKGQRSRSGSKRYAWFEGGQMPLQRRIPKRGFKSPFKVVFQVVNLTDLEKMSDIDTFTPEILLERRKVRKKNIPVKILGRGEITRPVKVSAHAFSVTAKEKIEKAGGNLEVITC